MKKIYGLWITAVLAAVAADITVLVMLAQRQHTEMEAVLAAGTGNVNTQWAIVMTAFAAAAGIILIAKRHSPFHRTDIRPETQEPVHNKYIFRGNHE